MIELNVKNQKLQRVDKFSPATDSVDYLTVKFNFLTNKVIEKLTNAIVALGGTV